MGRPFTKRVAAVGVLLALGVAPIVGATRRARAGGPSSREVVAGAFKRLQGRLGALDLRPVPGAHGILKMRRSGEAVDGHALFSASDATIVRRVPRIATVWKRGTTLREFVRKGTFDIKSRAQTVTIFLSTGWRPRPYNWRQLPATEQGEPLVRGATISKLKSMQPFPMQRLPPMDSKTVHCTEVQTGRAVRMSGFDGRLYVTHRKGQVAVATTMGIQQTKPETVDRVFRALGYLVVEEGDVRLGISVEAKPVDRPWVPAMSAKQFEALMETIAGAVRDEMAGGAPPPDAKPQPEQEPVQPSGPTKPAETPAEAPVPGPVADVIAVLVRAGRHQQALLRIRAQLRAGVVALEEEHRLLADVRATLAVTPADSPHRAGRVRWAREIEARIAELEKEQAGLLEEAGRGWDGLRKQLDDVLHAHEGHAAVRRDLEAFRQQLELRQQVSDLELLLAAGRSAELRARLPAALAKPALAERASLLQVGDLLERRRMAAALRASRMGAARYPDNATFARFVEDLESAYLKAISNRAADDDLHLRAAWNAYVEGADRSYAWQMFFGGLKRTYHLATSKATKLEVLATSAFDRAAMERNGLELMWRLRKRGLSFDQIQDLDTEGLRTQLVALAPGSRPPGQDTLEDFSLALKAAFMNANVMNLRYPGRKAVALAEGNAYGAGEFEETWAEWALASVNAKNALMVFGPAATLGSIPGNLARLATRFGQGKRVAAAFGADASALTIGEWAYSTRAAQGVAEAVAESRAGAVLREAGHVLRDLRYHDSALVRWTTAGGSFATQMAAHWLLLEGAGAVGERLGGERGRVAAELTAGLVGLPGMGSTARLQKRMQRARAALEAARRKATLTEAVLKTLRAPVHEAATTLARGGALTGEQRGLLTQALRAAGEAAENARTAASKLGGAALVAAGADEAEALAATARATLAGRAEDAAAASQIARTLRRQGEAAAEALEASERTLQSAVTRRPPTSTVATRQVPLAPDSAPALLGEPAAARTRIPRLDDPVPPAPRADPTVREASLADLLERAEEAMGMNEFERAAALLHTAARHPEIPADTAARVRAALAEARGAARAQQVFAERAQLPRAQALAREADTALRPFDEAQRRYLRGLERKDMTPLPGIGGARRIDGPDGTPLAIWKPGRRAAMELSEDGQIAAEILMSRLGRRLGLRVPHAEPLMVDGIRGVVVRWIPKTTNLGDLSPGARAALKSQVAAFRPLQTVMGNFDLHMGNVKVDRAGRVWAIDAGESIFSNPGPVPARFGPRADLSDNVNWTRWLRDWYEQRGASDPTYAGARRMHHLLRGRDLRPAATRLQALTREELAAAVEAAVRTAPRSAARAEEIVATLVERRDALPLLLNERWQGALR